MDERYGERGEVGSCAMTLKVSLGEFSRAPRLARQLHSPIHDPRAGSCSGVCYIIYASSLNKKNICTHIYPSLFVLQKYRECELL